MTHEERSEALARAVDTIDGWIVASESNRRYLSGFTGSSAALVIAPGRRFLVTDFRYLEQAAREAPAYTVVRHGPGMWRDVVELLRREGFRRVGLEAEHTTMAVHAALSELAPEIEWVGEKGRVEALRVVKDAEEVAALAEAARIASAALERTLAKIRPGISELEVAVELEWQMRQLGSEGLSFDTIVASGPRGSLPHGRPGRRTIAAGDLVTVDFGATFHGYHSDETVTVAVGDPGGEARRVYDLVARAQAAGIEAVRPGVLASEVDRAARQIIETEGFGAYFGHSTGHGVGLEVHEAPWAAPRPGTDYRLEAGMTVTVEPGIYLPERLGVRLEDTLVVTAEGRRRLTGVDKGFRSL
jgi:Xaa-Pro aminopeptidase